MIRREETTPPQGEPPIPGATPRLVAPRGLEAFRLGDDPQIAILSWPIGAARTSAPALSRAESEVLQLLLEGLSNADIAARRGRSRRTIANQVVSIFVKLQVRGRAELFARLTAPHPDERDE